MQSEGEIRKICKEQPSAKDGIVLRNWVGLLLYFFYDRIRDQRIWNIRLLAYIFLGWLNDGYRIQDYDIPRPWKQHTVSQSTAFKLQTYFLEDILYP